VVNAVRTPAPNVVRFGLFEVDLRSGELRKNGIKLKLSGQPFQVLSILLERPGQVVTREELQNRLWPDTFVDVERNLNTAINKIREVLEDSSESPRFVETVPRKGYRFVYPLTRGSGTKQLKNLIPPTLAARLFIALALAVTALLLSIEFGSGNMFSRAPRIQSLAVLPLDNLSHDGTQEYLSDGITDALITDFAKIDGLRVISRQSVMQFKNSRMPLKEIARTLHVDAVLEGTAEREGERVRISVHLVQAMPERQLWAEEYDESMGDLLGLQRQIAGSVAREIRAKLTPELRNVETRAARNAEAYADYLKALYVENKASTVPEYQDAIDLCQRSIQEDPTFSPAYAELAISYFWLAHPEFDGVPVREVLFPARAAASRAIQLDPNSVRGHLALGLLATSDYNWAEAEAEYRASLSLDRNCAECRHQYAALLQALGRNTDSEAEIRRAIEADPLNDAIRNQLAFIAFTSHQSDVAISRFEELGNAAWSPALAMAYASKGMYSKAIETLKKCNLGRTFCTVRLATVYGYSGDQIRAKKIVAQLLAISKKQYVFPEQIAEVYLVMGDKEQAIIWLERAYEERDPALFWLKSLPMWDSLRPDPRFQGLLRKVNFAS